MEIAVFIGSYERFVFKLDCSLNEEVKLQRSATHAAHLGPVKCISSLGRFVFSGAQDNAIQTFDVKSGMNNGFVQVPDVTSVTSLTLFPLFGGTEPTFLLDGCSDGTLHFWKTVNGEWELQKTKTFHKASVTSIDIHSSGKVAFSLAKERSLVLWDLAKSKRAFSCKLAVEGEKIKFHPFSSENYFITHQNTVSKLSLSNDQSVIKWTQMADVQDFCCWKEQSFVTASDDGALRLWDERTSKPELKILDAHSARIKGLSIPNSNHFVTASSDGVVKVWDARNLNEGYLAQEETDARITCLTSITYNPQTKSKLRSKRRR